MYTAPWLLLFRVLLFIHIGLVSTYAGSGSAGSADGSVTSAQFQFPFAIYVSSMGTVYVTDTGSNRIRVIYSGGCIRLICKVELS